jgi:hypothetical protein
MKAKAKFFDPLYGWVQKGDYIPNDAQGHRLLAAGHVVRDDEYETKVLRPKPKRRRKNAKPDDQQPMVDQSGEAESAADPE